MVKKVVYWPLVRLFIILLLCPVTLYGCDDNDDYWNYYDIHCDCGDEMAYFRAIYGEPEEIHRYDDDDYHMRVWWYWSLGFKLVFEWFEDWTIDEGECCRVSIYNIEPSYDESGRLILDLFKEEQERKTEKPNHP
jgi:hypothetical protein